MEPTISRGPQPNPLQVDNRSLTVVAHSQFAKIYPFFSGLSPATLASLVDRPGGECATG